MHDTRTLRVADQRKLLVRASNGLELEAVHDIDGTLEGAGNDVGAGGILSIQSQKRKVGIVQQNDGRAHLNRVSSSAGKDEGSVANNRVANNNTEFATARCEVRLAGAPGWMGDVCLISLWKYKKPSATLTDKNLVGGTTSWDVLWAYRDWISNSHPSVWKFWAGARALSSDSCQ